jgi:hypothetical protein
MRASNLSEKRRCRAHLHVAMWVAGGVAIVATSRVRAAVEASPTAVPADTRSIVKPLAAAAASALCGITSG